VCRITPPIYCQQDFLEKAIPINTESALSPSQLTLLQINISASTLFNLYQNGLEYVIQIGPDNKPYIIIQEREILNLHLFIESVKNNKDL
jgi:hypothetical protein